MALYLNNALGLKQNKKKSREIAKNGTEVRTKSEHSSTPQGIEEKTNNDTSGYTQEAKEHENVV